VVIADAGAANAAGAGEREISDRRRHGCV
jgi:hypothetical protein